MGGAAAGAPFCAIYLFVARAALRLVDGRCCGELVVSVCLCKPLARLALTWKTAAADFASSRASAVPCAAIDAKRSRAAPSAASSPRQTAFTPAHLVLRPC